MKQNYLKGFQSRNLSMQLILASKNMASPHLKDYCLMDMLSWEIGNYMIYLKWAHILEESLSRNTSLEDGEASSIFSVESA